MATRLLMTGMPYLAPTRSQTSVGYIRIDPYGVDGNTPPTVTGTGTQTTTHIVRPVGFNPSQDVMIIRVDAGGYATAGTVSRVYRYRWEE